MAIAPTAAVAQQLPTGGSVAAGSATIGTPQGGTLNINQSSDRAIINWQGFSIGQGGTVNFHQPGAASATLNRVTGSTPSSIAGAINAPGTVLLVNPNGIAITKDGVINTGSFAASTLDIKNSDFMSGNYKFTGSGDSQAVTNAGRINVSDGGFAALLGGQVANNGVITARLGKVALGSGELITLDLSGDGFLSVAVPTKDLGKIKGIDGQALVTNRGKIVADGGLVALKAATVAGVLRDAVNVPGSISANSVGVHNGRIVLGGGAGGRVRVAGRVRANGRRIGNGGTIAVTGADIGISGKLAARGGREGKGGVVLISADQVALGETAKLNVSGGSGGTLLIGGDVHGGADPSADFSATPVTNASSTTIAAGAVLKADGTSGDGGNVVVWSNDHTTFAGKISAAGTRGRGGFAEVSSHRLLDFTGSVDLAGTAGAGTLLLDPYSVIISNGANNTGGSYTANADDSVINIATLEAALASGNVIVTTGGSGSAGSQAGDITVADAVTWSADHNLTLDAYHSITINASVSATANGGLSLITNDGGTDGVLQFNAAVTIAGGSAVSINTNGGDYNFGPTAGAGMGHLDFTGGSGSGASLSINGNAYHLLYSMADVDGIDGVAASGNAINTQSGGLSGHYALAGSLIATGTTYTDALVGTGSGNPFTGIFEGLGHTITGLTVDKTGAHYTGLFGYSAGTIRDIGLVGGSITGRSDVGGLAGENTGTIAHAYSGATVTGDIVTSTNGNDIGGLVGLNAGTVAQSYATGAISGRDFVGGLVGEFSSGTITQSYATGAVSGTSAVGGLVGDSYGTITQAYASGAVSGNTSIGGLIGSAAGTISNAYATGAVIGIATSISAPEGVGGLAGYNGGTITQSYATGAVSGGGGTDIGGLVGFNDTGARVTYGYYDAGTSGQANGIGHDGNSQTITALTTAQFQSGTLPSGFDSTVWATGSGLYPYLKNFFPNGVQAVSGFAYKDAGATPLASGAAGAAYVSAIANGVNLGSVTTGANGYYYILTSVGTFSSGDSVLAYTTADAATGATNAATVASATGAANQASANVYGNTLTGMTAATLLSAAPTLAQVQTDAIAAAYGDTGALAAIGGTSGRGLIGAGASFTIDQAITVPGILVLATADGTPLTVASPISIASTGSVGLMSGGALVINAPVSVTGAGSVALGAAYDTTTVPGRSLLELSFGNGATIDYGTIDNSGALSINGQGYTLLYSMADIDGIDGVAASGKTINTQSGGLSGHYALASSLIAAGTIYTDALAGRATFSGDVFSGTFEGLGHTISGLTVNKTGGAAFTGLFGYSGGTIRDIGLVGGAIDGISDVGGLVGYNTGTIARAYATGTVTGHVVSSSSGDQIGGLVGVNSGTIVQSYAAGAVSGRRSIGGLAGEVDSGTITQSYATGAITGDSFVGGLIGRSFPGTITQSYATGAVNGNSSVGGLVGEFDNSRITQSYATGAVNGSSNAGGLVGYNYQGTITQSYATGAVRGGGGSDIGGLVGYNDFGATITNSYWDTYATGQASGFGVNNGTVTNLVAVTSDPGQSASASYAFTQSAYGNLNFGTDWFMIDGQTRPFGQWEHATTIINAHQLQLMSMDLNASYTLGANIDASETFGANPSGMWTTAGFVPVGAGSGFNGSLDGRGFTISSLSIDRPLEDNIGLIGTLYGTINDVGLIGAEVSGNQNVGALIGSNYGIVSNSYATVDVCGCGEVDGVGSVGGLVGASLGQISGSHADVAVFGFGNSVGGLVGFAGAGSIDTSYATGTVYGDLVTATNVGGLIGSTNPGVTVSNSYATGAVEGNTAIGGLVGYNLATVTQSYALGNVRGTDKIGGLVGWNDATGSLQGVFADGLVGGVSGSNSTNVGGLVGQNDGSVTDAYAAGAVAGDDFVGGLIGRNGAAGSVTNAYAAGWVTLVNGSTANFGALAGANQGTVTNAYWNTQASGQATAIGVDSGSSSTFGDTTAQLQAALPAGFASSIWGIIPGISTPYMNWRFPNGPTVVSGTAAGFSGGNAGLVVGVAIDGTVLPNNAVTGADGSYLFMLDPAAAGGAAFTWLTRDYFPNGSSRPSNAVADLVSSAPGFAQGQATGLDFAPDRVLTVASNAIVNMDGVIALMERALYGPTLSTSVPDQLFNVGYDPIRIVRFDASTSFSELAFTPFGGADYRLQSAAANFDLNEPLGCGCDLINLEVVASGNLAINQSIIAGGSVLMTAPGDITIGPAGSVEADGTGDAIVLAAGGRFVNEAGTAALDVSDPTGRWLVYSNTPAGDTFGGLDSGNTASWHVTYATLPPASVTQRGNRYLFSYQPTLTFTTTDVSKNYGDDATAAVALAYSVSGIQPGVSGAFLGDTATDVYSGAPSVTSLGSAAAASAGGSPYSIDAAAGSLTALNGYAVQFVSTGRLTVTTGTVNPIGVNPTGGGTTPVSIEFQQISSAPVTITTRTAFTPPANQNIAPGSGPDSLYPPISQFDRNQYTDGTLPDFAPQAGEATVLTMIARAEQNNRKAPKIDALWQGADAAWPTNDNVLKNVSFSDGDGQSRTPAGNNGFTFTNGTTDIGALLQHGPVMLGGLPSGGQVQAPWLLAIKMTDDGKGIIANDPLTGDQVVLTYDPASKMVGAVTAVLDPADGKPVSLGTGAPALTGQKTQVPDAAWSELKAFKAASYFAVAI